MLRYAFLMIRAAQRRRISVRLFVVFVVIYVLIGLLFILVGHTMRQVEIRPKVGFAPLPKVIVIGLDGLRHDFLTRLLKTGESFTSFRELMRKGAWIKKIEPCFPANTAPNFACISTGLYTESHGVIDNSFHIPNTDGSHRYSLNESNTVNPWNDDVIPLWELNEKFSTPSCNAPAHECRKSAVIMWPPMNDDTSLTPTQLAADSFDSLRNSHVYSVRYASGRLQVWKKSIDVFLSWMFHESHPANLGFLYFEDLDFFANRFDPDSTEVIDILRDIDFKLGYLLKALNLEDSSHPSYSAIKSWSDHGRLPSPLHGIDLVIVGDHGLTRNKPESHISIDSLLPSSLLLSSIIEGYNTLRIRPKERVVSNRTRFSKWKEDMGSTLRKKSLRNKFSMYSKDELPERFHYKGARCPEFVLVSKRGTRLHSKAPVPSRVIGLHGFDPAESDMHTALLGVGPSFKEGFQLSSVMVSAVDVYPLLCYLLKIPPNPHNGTLERISPILR